MPNEILCTENLTPWIKLLPCGKSRGLGQLFRNTHRLIESHYFMANLHFRPVDLLARRFELVQTLSLVYSTELTTKQRAVDDIEWTLNSIFKRKLESTCPAANSSNVFIRQNKNGVGFYLTFKRLF
jgi:phosphatidylinositol glycan class T